MSCPSKLCIARHLVDSLYKNSPYANRPLLATPLCLLGPTTQSFGDARLTSVWNGNLYLNTAERLMPKLMKPICDRGSNPLGQHTADK